MKHVSLPASIVAIALVLGLGVANDQPAAKTPEEVVTLYFERVTAEGLGSVSDMIHPEELKKFRQMLEPMVKASLGEKDDTFELFADANHPAQVRAMNDVEFMNTFMTWVSLTVPAISVALRNATMQAIGHVTEGDVRHVVVRARTKAEDIEIEKMSVWSVRDFEGQPMLMMMGDIKGLAHQLKRGRRP